MSATKKWGVIIAVLAMLAIAIYAVWPGDETVWTFRCVDGVAVSGSSEDGRVATQDQLDIVTERGACEGKDGVTEAVR